MSLRFVTLDFGHTLAREVPSRHAIYAALAREAGIAVDEPTMRAHMTRAHAELPVRVEGGARYSEAWFRLFIERVFHGYLGLPADRVPALAEALLTRFSDAATFELFPGAFELCANLRARGLKVGVISNWSPALAGLLDGLGLTPFLDPVVCSAVEGIEKPDPAIFDLALERAGIPAKDALHAGDRLDFDCKAAEAVGMRSVLVEHQGMRSGDSSARNGRARVTSLLELQAHILTRLPP